MMAAFGCYANATKYVMNSHELSDDYLLLLQEAFTPLRFYLSCRVCNKILQNPMTPDHTACQHTVCAKCIGGKMKLKPRCGWCQGYENFTENKSLAFLITCYSKLCQYVLSSSDYRKQLQFANNCNNSAVESSKDKMRLWLKEGVKVASTTTPSSSSSLRQNETSVPSTINRITTSTNDNMKSNISPSPVPPRNAMSMHPEVSNNKSGDLMLKLVIPGTGKKRCWRTTTLPAVSSSLSKKKTLTFTKRKVKLHGNITVNENGKILSDQSSLMPKTALKKRLMNTGGGNGRLERSEVYYLEDSSPS